MPECRWCGEDIDFDEGYVRHQGEWCDARPEKDQQTLTEATH